MPESAPGHDLHDLIVVGGGIAGASLAWAAVEAGLRVRVVEDRPPTASATWASGGMLAPGAEGLTGEEARLGQAALAEHRRLQPRLTSLTGIHLGAGRGFLRSGLHTPTRRTPPPADLGVTPPPGDACWLPDDGWVDPRSLLLALRRASRLHGADWQRGRVQAIELSADEPRLSLADGRSWSAERIVLAAGHAAAAIEGLPWARLGGTRGDRGVLLRLAGVEPPPCVLFHLDEAGAIYVVPDAQGVRVGATSGIDDPRPEADALEIATLIDRASRLWPLNDAQLSEAVVGFRPLGPGAGSEPWVGPLDRVGRAWGLLGLHRNGILLAPWLARGLIAALQRGQMPPAPGASLHAEFMHLLEQPAETLGPEDLRTQ